MSHTEMFESGLFGRLRQSAGAHWQHYVDHPFLQQLGAGTLPESAFRRYLTQDYLFLVHFSRAYALLVTKFTTLADIRTATHSLNAIVAELPLHISYCSGWGLSEEHMANEPEAAETISYTRYVLDIGHSGDALELLVALLPCVAGYAEAGLHLLHSPKTVMTDNPYAPWMQNYSDPEYLNSVRAAIEMLDRVGQQRGADTRFARLSEIFTTATRLESAFWQMGLNAAGNQA